MDLSGRHKGLVRRDQLLALGIPPGTIDGWVARGLLHPIHHGVYMVGQPLLLPGADLLAAVWACGPPALLSHRSAAEHWALVEPRDGLAIQVTAPGHRRPGPKGIYVHRTRFVSPDDASQHDGVPATSPARTVFDFASQATRAEVAAAYEQGLIDGRFTRDEMIFAAMRLKGRRGIKKVRALIDRDAPPTVTVREAHRKLLELLRSSGLPHPKSEVEIGNYRVDLLWPDAQLIVEMDSTKWHTTPGKLEHDKRRDAELAAMGYLTIRVTWNELTKHPMQVVTRIAQAYARRLPPARSTST